MNGWARRVTKAWLVALWACGPREVALPDLSGRPTVDDFALIDHTGAMFQLSRVADAKLVVVYTYGAGCPIARQQVEQINALAKKYAGKVQFVMLDANPQDDRAALAEEASAYGIAVPVLHDDRQLVAEGLGVVRTAEAIVLAPAQRRVAWRGPLDDRLDYGAQRPAAAHAWLEEALDGLLAGALVASPTAEVRGCLVSLPAAKASRAERGVPTPEYVHDVAPILAARCQRCHRPGGIGPWAMTSYEVVRGWAPMMREVIRTRRMPPWHADPAIGTFDHDLSLSPSEAAAIVHWAEEGAPRGEGEDPLAAPLPALPEWPLGEPDYVITLPTQKIPANGFLPYRHFEVDVPVTEPVWIRAAHVLPGNAKILHHGTAFHLDEETLQSHKRGKDLPIWRQSLLTTFVPGMWDGDVFPEESGRLLKPGEKLRFTMHYVTTGKKESDTTRVALYASAAPPPHVYRVIAVAEKELDLPPGARITKTAAWRPETAIRIYKVFPHMHLRGVAFRLEVELPDGRVETLVSLPRYDFGWQRWYELSEPYDLPAGSEVRAIGTFDNTAANPFNPDPTAHVRWGEQTVDEMMIGYVAWRER